MHPENNPIRYYAEWFGQKGPVSCRECKEKRNGKSS